MSTHNFFLISKHDKGFESLNLEMILRYLPNLLDSCNLSPFNNQYNTIMKFDIHDDIMDELASAFDNIDSISLGTDKESIGFDIAGVDVFLKSTANSVIKALDNFVIDEENCLRIEDILRSKNELRNIFDHMRNRKEETRILHLGI